MYSLKKSVTLSLLVYILPFISSSLWFQDLIASNFLSYSTWIYISKSSSRPPVYIDISTILLLGSISTQPAERKLVLFIYSWFLSEALIRTHKIVDKYYLTNHFVWRFSGMHNTAVWLMRWLRRHKCLSISMSIWVTTLILKATYLVMYVPATLWRYWSRKRRNWMHLKTRLGRDRRNWSLVDWILTLD